MGRVANEHRFVRLVSELGERHLHRVGIRLVNRARVRADQRLHIDVDPGVPETALHHLVALARHDAHGMTPIVELLERLEYTIVRRRELVVVQSLIAPVTVFESYGFLVGFDEFTQLYFEWGSNSGYPFFLSRRASLEAVEGVFHRREKQPDRVDESSVEIEEDGVAAFSAHCGKLILAWGVEQWRWPPPATIFERLMSSSPRSAFKRLLDENGAVDQVGIDERVAKFTTRSIKKKSKLWGLTTAVSMVDLTTLEGKDTPGKVRSLCQKARHPSDDPEVPPVAAVCIYPFLVKHARKWLADTPIKVASVATGFPSGQSPLKLRIAEVKQAVADGADEVDMVINRGLFLSGQFDAVQDEISAVVEACGDATLKVILEVSELESFDNIRAASFIAMRAIREGDFIKTSTGKASGAATLANTQVMLEAIRDHYLATGVAIGMKPAGGIRNAKQALHYLVAVKETLGDAWLNSSRYRFGASSLLNDLLRQIQKEKTGAYQAPYYFTEAAESY